MVDSLMMIVCLSLLGGWTVSMKDTLRRRGGDGLVFLGLRSMMMGSGE